MAFFGTKITRTALAVSSVWMQIFVAFGLGFSAFSQSARLSETDTAVFTNALQILRLTPDQAQSNLPVRIRGIVTCYDHGNLLFVQDETAGIFVHYSGERLRIGPGQQVQVSGYAGKGRYSPIVISTAIIPLDSGPIVSPRPVSLGQIQYGALDAQWIEVAGDIRQESVMGQHLSLQLVDSPHRIQVWFVDGGGDGKQSLLGSRVRVRGVVCSRTNPQGQLQGFQVCANSISDVTVLQSASTITDPFSAPRRWVRDLGRYGMHSTDSGRVTVRGVVTLYQPGRRVFVQDETGGLEVRILSVRESLQPGDTVEVAGYPGPILEPSFLEDAVARKVAPPIPLPTVAVSPEDLFQHRYHNELVEVEGYYLGRANVRSNGIDLVVQADGYPITALLDSADLPKAIADLRAGSLLRFTGVCRSEVTNGDLSSVSLLLRSPADVEVVSGPVSPPRTGPALLAGAALLSAIGLLAALWFMRNQRRQTDHVLQLYAALQSEMRQSEQQLRRSVDERERIGRDLHDDIIQSIYAAGLSLEDSRRMLRQSPEQAEARLKVAIHTLNDTIRGVRGFIAGLEPKVLNGRELKTALKSLALTSGEAPAPFQILVEPDAANILTSTEATQLLHIAKEAMSNSLRHGHASRVTVSLKATGSGIQLEIADDGVGFAPALVQTGQGLRNMATRAREIGGSLQTISSPGEGCRILVIVPPRNSHEHD